MLPRAVAVVDLPAEDLSEVVRARRAWAGEVVVLRLVPFVTAVLGSVSLELIANHGIPDRGRTPGNDPALQPGKGVEVPSSKPKTHVAAQAASDHTRESALDRRSPIQLIDEGHDEVLEEVEDRGADGPAVENPAWKLGGGRSGHLCVIEGRGITIVWEIERYDRVAHSPLQSFLLKRLDKRKSLLCTRRVTVDEQDHLVTVGHVRDFVNRHRACRGRRGRRRRVR